MKYNDTLIIIPARLNSTRLAKKVLINVNGKTIIEHVLHQVSLTDVPRENIIVACDHNDILEVVQNAGYKGILTNSDLSSGTDRIYQALTAIDHSQYNYIVNVQGDLPNIKPETIHNIIDFIKESDEFNITTAACIISTKDAFTPSIVKPVLAMKNDKHGKALYFTRSITPYGHGDYYKHIGVYAFDKASLEKFVQLEPSVLEKREKLEQIRALENNMSIGVVIVEDDPISIDTNPDLEKFINQVKE